MTASVGPWKRQGRFVKDCRETLAGMRAVRSATGVVIGAFDRPEDAELAASAPDMLAVLKDAVGEYAIAYDFGEHVDFQDIAVWFGKWRETAKAVIAKAEGRSQ